MLAFNDFYRSFQAAQYDGSNAADVRTFIESITGNGTTSMAGTVIVNPVAAVHVGDWVVKSGLTFVVEDDFSFSGTAKVDDVLVNVAPELVVSEGSTAVTASVGGSAGRDFDVTLSPAMSSTDYVPVVSLRGAPGIISGHGIVGAAVIDADTVRVTVASAALSLSGASVHVIAYELG